jgi:hypothetical protein
MVNVFNTSKNCTSDNIEMMIQYIYIGTLSTIQHNKLSLVLHPFTHTLLDMNVYCLYYDDDVIPAVVAFTEYVHK